MSYKSPKNHTLKVKSLANTFTSFSVMRENARKKFANNKWFIDPQSGEFKGKLEPQTLGQTLSIQSKQVNFALQQIQYLNQGKEALFLTFTLPPSYHSKINGRVNYEYCSNKIELGKNYLIQFITTIKDKLKKKKYDLPKIDFVQIIEPHDDYTPHLHIQMYIDAKYISQITKLIQNSIDYNLKYIGTIGTQYKIEHIKDLEHTNISSYIAKYITKNIENQGEEHKAKDRNNNRSVRKIDGWKRLNKVRMFSHSRIPIPKEYYNKVVELAPNNMIDEEKGENIAIWALNNIEYITNIKDVSSLKLHKKTKINNTSKTKKYTIVKSTLVYREKFDINIKKKRKKLYSNVYKNLKHSSILIHSNRWYAMVEMDFEKVIETIYNINNYKVINNINYEPMFQNIYYINQNKVIYDDL
jgi:hypothetical protein